MTRLAKCALCVMVSFFALFGAVGYASTSANLNVSGEVIATPPRELYVVTLEQTSALYGGGMNNVYSAHPTNVNSNVTLPSKTSTVTLRVTVFNNTDETYEFNRAKYFTDKYSNENITFSLTNVSNGKPLLHGDSVEAGEYLSFDVTFKYKDGYTPKSSESLSSLINYEFVPKSTLPPIYIKNVEIVSGTGSFSESSIGTNTLNARFTSGIGTVYKLTMANRSDFDYGYYATVITNASDTTDISLVDYKLYKDAEKTSTLVRRDLLPKASEAGHGTIDIYLSANGRSGVSSGTELHTIFDIRFQTPIEEIPPPGVEDGEIAVENALDKFREILNTPTELQALIDLLNDVPTSWGSTLRNSTYVAYVPGAPESDREASLELFDGQLEIYIENQKQEVYFLIKREDVTGDGKDDFTVYMTTNPLTEESTVSNRNWLGNYYTTYNKSLAIVYAAVFTEDDYGEWIQLGDMFKGDAPICDYNGGMKNYRPSGSGSNISVPTGKGSFHTDTWVTTEVYYDIAKGSSLPTILSKEAYDLALLKSLIDIAVPITTSDDYVVIYTKESRDVLDRALLNAQTVYSNNTDANNKNNNTQAEIPAFEKALEKAIKGLKDSV